MASSFTPTVSTKALKIPRQTLMDSEISARLHEKLKNDEETIVLMLLAVSV